MSKPKTYGAEAAIELSAPLWLGPEFLGLLKQGRIGGVDVHIVLPDFKRLDGVFQTSLHSRAQVDWIGSFEKRDRDEDRDWPFGGVAKWKGAGEVTEFSAHRLLALFRKRVTTAEARKFKLAVDDWAERLETWIEVITREDMHKETIKVDRQGDSAFVWIDRGKKPGEIMAGKKLITIQFGSPLPITPWQWGKVLAKASAGTAPPEAHLFLRDARHAANTGHYRRSVLDSATAAELSLAKLRDDYLFAESNSRLAAFVGRRARHIDGISKFLGDMGRTLPNRIKEEVSDPRNDAIHAGHELDEKTAGAALGKAEEVVDIAFPWRKLL